MTTVLIADDHAVVAQGLAALLKDNFLIAGIVHDGRTLLEAARSLRPDVILTDISMPGLNGIDAIRMVKEQQPECKIMVLTMHADAQMAAQSFRLGASGYVLKSAPGEELIAAIKEVSQGRGYLTPTIARGLIGVLLERKRKLPTAAENLTSRQREVLQLLAEGKTMKETAAILHISPRTVESHKYEMMQTLGITTNAELVQYAIRLKLIGG
jgi:DNA-binding NarL/FixJ family response regulator